MEEIQDGFDQRAYAIRLLTEALEAFGGSASALAQKAGVSTSTITRPLKDPENSAVPKWATIAKVMAAAGLSGPPAIGSFRIRNQLHVVEIVGEVRHGVWFEGVDDRDYGPPIVLSLGDKRPAGMLGAYISGPDDGNEPSTYLIADQGLRPTSGDRLIFRRTKGELIETSSYRYQIDAGRHTLQAHGQPAITTSIRVIEGDGNPGESPGVLMGVVVARLWLRP